jgi:hypothetical protein
VKTVGAIFMHGYRKRPSLFLATIANILLATAMYSADNTNGPAVDALYAQLLERGPDDEGRANWSRKLDQGVSVKSIVHDFIHSPEYKLRFVDGKEHKAVVEKLYEHVLARPGEPQGVMDWTRALESLKGKTCCRQVKFYFVVYALGSWWFCLSRILKAGPGS